MQRINRALATVSPQTRRTALTIRGTARHIETAPVEKAETLRLTPIEAPAGQTDRSRISTFEARSGYASWRRTGAQPKGEKLNIVA